MYLRALLAGMAVIWLTACSEPDPGPTTYALPDAAEQPDTGAGFQFSDIMDDAGDRVPNDLESGGETVEPTDSETETDQTTADADDADADTGPGAITSCVGHCGILLIDIGNPCSCHPSCKDQGNCCTDFIVACTCESGGDAACDDANDCTLDSCKSGYCLQLPVPSKSCCHADAECKGGDKCTVPKCIQGTCSPQTTNCDDGLACTNDVCDPATGACVNKQITGQCVIDGACHKAGDTDPESTGCSICDPSKSTSAWSAKAGTCSIDGMCWKTGEAGPAGTCAVCDAAKSTSAWTIKASNCLIDGKCFAATTPNPANATCEVCDPATSTSAWSGMPGKCAIDGLCYDKDTPDPAAPDCSVCDPAKNKAGFSLKTGFCLIDGSCIKAAAMQAGSFGCATCSVEKSTTAWSAKAAATACDDGTMCTSGDKCDGKGACKGTALANCCIADEDCANATYTDGAPGPCEISACKEALGTCEKQAVATCCTSGVCCDLEAKAFKAKNTPCSTFVKNKEYQCSGNDAQMREIFNGCTGTDASKCSSDTPGYGQWKTVKTCSAGTACKVIDPTQTPGCPPIP